MATLQVRDIDDRIYERLKRISRIHKRSMSQEVIHIIESYLSDPNSLGPNSTDEFLKLTGSWEDDRSADEIVTDLRRGRTNNRRFTRDDGVFD